MVKLSIVVVTWNGKALARECLRSILEQKGAPPLELIVVDNASSDGTPELIASQFPRVTLVSNKVNLGFAKANNIGIRLSSGSYVCLINSDVSLAQDCLGKIYDYMESHLDVGILGPKMLNRDGTAGCSCSRFPTIWNTFCAALALNKVFPHRRILESFEMHEFRHDRIADVEVLFGWFWAVRRAAIESTGLLDERFFMYGEDIDWCKRFHNAGWRLAFYPYAEAVHYGGGSSASAPVRFYLEMHRARLQYWRLHGRREHEIAFLAVAWLHHSLRVIGYAALYVLWPSRRLNASFKLRRSLACIRWLLKPETSLRETQ